MSLITEKDVRGFSAVHYAAKKGDVKVWRNARLSDQEMLKQINDESEEIQNLRELSCISCHGKYSQSQYRNAVAHSTLIVSPNVFPKAWYKLVMQRSLVVYHGISLLSLVFSWYTHLPKGSHVYQEMVYHQKALHN